MNGSVVAALLALLLALPGSAGADAPTAFDGLDLVELFPRGAGDPNIGREALGIDRHALTYEGSTFLFASDANRRRFEREPARYLPGAGGFCALGLHRRATGAPHNGELLPPIGKVRCRTFGGTEGDRRWYFHGSCAAEEAFEAIEDLDLALAQVATHFEKLRREHPNEVPLLAAPY